LVANANEGYALHMSLVSSVVEGWLERVKLKEKWKHQKHTSAIAGVVTSWPFLAGVAGSAVVGGVLIAGSNQPSDNQGNFATPVGRPGQN
jgi:hypothetical protein